MSTILKIKPRIGLTVKQTLHLPNPFHQKQFQKKVKSIEILHLALQLNDMI
jgi:hypothetical protein